MQAFLVPSIADIIVAKIENGLERGFVKHRLNCLLVTDTISLTFKVISLHLAEKFIATSAYKAELDDEMSFELGVLVTVLEKNFDGWWLVR